MKTFKEYLLESKDFDEFVRMYSADPTNPAAAYLWDAMRHGYLADLIREDGIAEGELPADDKSKPGTNRA
jgi:hypothetical protein